MNRRPVSLVLIVLLLGSPLLRAEQAPTVRAQVHVRGASVGQLQALCDAAAGAGADVRVVRQGAQAVIEIAASGPAALVEAMAALKQSADAAGAETTPLPTRSCDPTDALAARAAGGPIASCKPLHPVPPAMFTVGAAGTAESLASFVPADDSPAPPSAPADSARLARGPPV